MYRRLSGQVVRDQRPIVEQEFDGRNLPDLLHEIPKIKTDSETAIVGMQETSPRAIAYCSGKEDDYNTYCLYCFYHNEDWSAAGGLPGYLDEHHHDFEGCLIIEQKGPIPRRRYIITVAHYDFICEVSWSNRQHIVIKSGGHGIYPLGRTKKTDTYVRYGTYDLFDIDSAEFQAHWPLYKQAFNQHGVKMPDQWNDQTLKRTCGLDTDGLIYNDPSELLKLLKKIGKL